METFAAVVGTISGLATIIGLVVSAIHAAEAKKQAEARKQAEATAVELRDRYYWQCLNTYSSYARSISDQLSLNQFEALFAERFGNLDSEESARTAFTSFRNLLEHMEYWAKARSEYERLQRDLATAFSREKLEEYIRTQMGIEIPSYRLNETLNSLHYMLENLAYLGRKGQ